MGITTFQAFILAFLVWFAKASFTPNLTYDWFKPLPASLFVGLVMGDFKTALAAGIAIQLVYMGHMVIGSVPPADIAIAAVVGSTFAVTLSPSLGLGAAVSSGLALAVAVATPATAFNTLNRTFATWTNEKSIKAGREGKLRMQRFWHWVPAQFILFILYFPITFIVLKTMGNTTFLETITKILIPISSHLSVLGSVLPAIGIALALRTITTKNTLPYIFLGFVLNAYLKVPILGVAIIGVCIAYLTVFVGGTKGKKEDNYQEI